MQVQVGPAIDAHCGSRGRSVDEYVDINYCGSVSRPKTFPYETTIMVRDLCLCLHVQRAARALARRFDEALRPYGLTNGQFSLLMSLNRPEPPAMGAVAKLLAMDRTTLTAALKPLERRGLVKASSNALDRRSRAFALTASGHDILIAAFPAWERTHRETEREVPGGDATALREHLHSLV